MRTCNCFGCGKELRDIGEEGKYLQPLDGLAFETTGHYGSAYFDPMDGTRLAVVICDACLTQRLGERDE
jgi:hypothetical protein